MAANVERYAENFRVGQVIEGSHRHIITPEEVAACRLYNGEPAFPTQTDLDFANAIGLDGLSVDELQAWNDVFGLTVPGVSLKAKVNLGYAEGQFLKPVYPGDSITAESEVIGIRETKDGKDGIIWVRTTGHSQRSKHALKYVRCVMIPKEDPDAEIENVPATLSDFVEPEEIEKHLFLNYRTWSELADRQGTARFGDYFVGQRIDHGQRKLIEADHMEMTRLHQNPAEVHFAEKEEEQITYGGLVIAISRGQSASAFPNTAVVAINQGTDLTKKGSSHVAITRPDDQISSWSEVVDKVELPDVGLLRVITRATRDLDCSLYPTEIAPDSGGGVVLQFDHWLTAPL